MGPVAGSRAAPAARPAAPLIWLDLIKGVAFLWIFLNHLSERLFGYPYIANPSGDWPPLAERVAQLAPLHGHGLWDMPLNLLRYVGWSGDQGVQLFLIASGFGLTWGLLQRQTPERLHLGRFFAARARRIYPLWWTVHVVVLFGALLLGHEQQVISLRFALSFIGLRLTPETLYFIASPWWYVGCLLQLYLLYPLLWRVLRRYGAWRMLLLSCATGVVLRGLGLLWLGDAVDAWSRGILALTRLPEFALGMALAAWQFEQRDTTGPALRSVPLLIGAAAVYVVGTLLSLSLLGMSVAPLFLGGASFVLLHALLLPSERSSSFPVRAVRWVGTHSYALYLVHQPLIQGLVPGGIDAAGPTRIVAGIAAAVVATIVATRFLEAGVDLMVRRLSRPAGLIRVVALALMLFLGGLAAEFAVRRYDPQEVFGWGERPSLQPDAELGWKLAPSRQTRLRWESYDYVVTANSLGFPGPDYPMTKPAATSRILTVGDAFTSAEGVDTNDAWPRLLEKELAGRLGDRSVQVLNFAITGYGPNQYAAVVEHFAPQYQPDVIIVSFFVNDFEDALISNDEFRGAIGFGRPAADGALAYATLAQLRQWVRLHVAEPLYARLSGRPAPHGYFLGQFATLERDQGGVAVAAAEKRVRARLAEIADTARRVGAALLIVMVPAPVQVCEPQQLAYFPRQLDLRDNRRFDLEQPQRMLSAIAADLKLSVYDLRPALRAVPECAYQANNLHWTRTGHQRVAAAVAGVVVDDKILGDGSDGAGR
jgi:peptidoglycan/LPS O-acetylase OafA/YrhL/lysophospholipase L1-like esterase